MLTNVAVSLLPALNWRVGLEILILFIGVYGILYYLRSTRASMIIAGIMVLWCGLSLLSRYFELEVLQHIIDVTGNSFVVILLVVFQPEIRRLLVQLGRYAVWGGKMRKESTREIVDAVEEMARRKCGALIVIENKEPLQSIVNDSVQLDCRVTSLLLESIFFPNSPLHDGAVIIRDDRIVAARAILPLTRAEHISRHLGTRHRAALGVSEEYDAMTVIVSEETGLIGLGYNGELYRDLTPEQLRDILVRRDEDLEESLRALHAADEHGEQLK